MKITRLIAPALLAAAISCGDAISPVRHATNLGLDAARQRWQAQNLHTYAFVLQRSCFCGNVHPLYVLVVNDTVAGALDLETAQSLDARMGETIDGLFAFIQTAVDRPAQKILAEYDGAKGFPTQIDYDGAAQIADDEIFFRVSDVHPISLPTQRAP